MRKSNVLIFVGGLLVLITGLLLVLAGTVLGFNQGGVLGAVVGITATAIGGSHLAFGIIMLASSIFHKRQLKWLATSFITSVFALVSGGGFFVGPMLGIVGTISAVFESDNQPQRRKRR